MNDSVHSVVKFHQCLFCLKASSLDEDGNNEWSDGTVNSYVRQSKFETYFI